jgi:hypothetical protein
MQGDQRSWRLRGDDGSVIVEAAIALPFLILMILGIIEVGFLIRSAAVTAGASRSGARLVSANYGSATNTADQLNVVDNAALTVEKDLASRASTDTPVALWIYKAGANGFPIGRSDFGACTSPCFQYTWNDASKRFIRVGGGSWSAPDACGASHDNVGVYVKVSHAAVGFSGFLGTTSLDEHTVMRLEPPSEGTANACPQGS